MGFFKKNKGAEPITKIDFYENILFEEVKNASTEYLTKLAEHLMKKFPLIGNFESLEVDEANKAISFLSGVIYALGGKVMMVNNYSFMFATLEAYQDKNIIELLEQII